MRKIEVGAPVPVDTSAASRLTDADVMFTRAEAAQYLRRSVPTLERWAALGIGPTFVKVGRRPLYPLRNLRRVVGAVEGEAA